MVIETGLHRWDADQAFDEGKPLIEHVARSGLDEYADMWLPRLAEVPTLQVVTTDLRESWVFGHGTIEKTVEGTASSIFLALMCRPGATLPEEWASAVGGIEPPSKR